MTYDYVIGMDVGKFSTTCAPSIRTANRFYPNASISTDNLFADFCCIWRLRFKALVVVDLPNNIGRYTVTIAQGTGITVHYLPGLAMRQLSRIHTGNSKTDVPDSYIIAYVGRNLPTSLRKIARIEETFLEW